jgi:chromosome segregation ATPase
MFGQIKLIFTIVILVGISGAVIYVQKLRADNAILKENQIKLEQAVSSQQQVIQQQKQDFEDIMKANKQLNTLVQGLKKDFDDLDKRFNKGGRDLGKIAIERSKAIERIVNKGTEAAARCIELASGAPHTEAELKATKKSEINRECPSIANPNYVPYE